MPCGFSQIARAGERLISTQAVATASNPRSCACGPPAWNAIAKACPVVCITALPISKLMALSRFSASMSNPVRVSGLAAAQAAPADLDAATRASVPAAG